MNPAPVEFLHYLGGKWVAGDGAQLTSTSPTRPDEVVARGRYASAAQVDQALADADAAREDWANAAMATRAAVLRKAAAIIREHAQEWGAELTREEGKTLPEGVGEVTRAAQVLEYQAGQADREAGEVYHSPRVGERIEVIRRPVGVVSCITPFNFPIAIPAWKMAPALIHGNTVVWKPADKVPLLAMRFASALHEAGLPAGVVNLVLPETPDANAMLTDPRVAAVTFTGSTAVGRTIAASCAAVGVPVQAELGGKNPAIVLADADIPHAVTQVINGAFNSSGQKCTATSRVAVVDEVADHFICLLSSELAARRTGDPLDHSVAMGPMVDAGPRDTALAAVRRSVSGGSTLIAGGGVPEVPGCAGGYFLDPTVIEVSSTNDELWVDELFAPVLAVLRVGDAEEAFAAADCGPYNLSAAVFTDSLAASFDAVDKLHTGMLHINSETSGADPHVPFGGNGASGFGPKEQGQAALEFFTKTTTMYLGRWPR
ncbi:aldehyde dehydrogenase family protein [Corynebacterium sp. TAE3-ERU12]|uniref:aldehyde dehydrogenase family protein n=1 Tax=Corynebacterium sp. TAE3-ERU12 TaxID=2849491 RepID=UPI001C44C455|nr:aldehyde dehydrogenase family protein [Corynebacterium sp. TAE3-ERU12]MBV7296005.1 aldehyde dehydrogenase family protein [Corynebacterium sp. TAE3-ERU12]